MRRGGRSPLGGAGPVPGARRRASQPVDVYQGRWHERVQEGVQQQLADAIIGEGVEDTSRDEEPLGATSSARFAVGARATPDKRAAAEGDEDAKGKTTEDAHRCRSRGRNVLDRHSKAFEACSGLRFSKARESSNRNNPGTSSQADTRKSNDCSLAATETDEPRKEPYPWNGYPRSNSLHEAIQTQSESKPSFQLGPGAFKTDAWFHLRTMKGMNEINEQPLPATIQYITPYPAIHVQCVKSHGCLSRSISISVGRMTTAASIAHVSPMSLAFLRHCYYIRVLPDTTPRKCTRPLAPSQGPTATRQAGTRSNGLNQNVVLHEWHHEHMMERARSTRKRGAHGLRSIELMHTMICPRMSKNQVSLTIAYIICFAAAYMRVTTWLAVSCPAQTVCSVRWCIGCVPPKAQVCA